MWNESFMSDTSTISEEPKTIIDGTIIPDNAKIGSVDIFGWS